MRGRKPTKGEGSEFGHLTEDLPKCRTRFRTEVLPDIGAWLLMVGYRHSTALAKMREVADESKTHNYAVALRDQELRVEIVANLLQIVGQPFNRVAWLAACEDFGRLYGGPALPPRPGDITLDDGPTAA